MKACPCCKREEMVPDLPGLTNAPCITCQALHAPPPARAVREDQLYEAWGGSFEALPGDFWVRLAINNAERNAWPCRSE